MDTNVLIGLHRSKKKTVEYLSNIDSAYFAITPFTYAEFLGGATVPGKIEAAKFLKQYPVVDFDQSAQTTLTKLCRQIQLQKNQLPDLLIASICLAHDYGIVTANHKHFTKFPNLEVLKVPQGIFS